MKRAKAILALILALTMLCTLLAACAKTETSSGNNAGTSTDESSEKQTNDSEEIDAADAADTTDDALFDRENPSEIVFWAVDMNNANGVDNQDRLEGLINEITEPKGIKVDLTFMQIGDYFSKVQTAIAGGEQIDLMCSFFNNNVPNLYKNGMAMDITALMEEYAPETLELMGDYLMVDTYNGSLYGVPVMRALVSNNYIVFREDLLNDAGLLEQAEQISSWSEFEAVLEGLAEYYSGTGVYAFVPTSGTTIQSVTALVQGDSFSDIQLADSLGDSLGVVYCLDDGKVQLYQASDSYRETCAKSAEWMEKGWIYPDSIFDADQMATEIISQGGGVAEWCASEYGIEAVKKTTFGTDALCIMTNSSTIKTSTLTNFGICVPTTAEEPEAAVYFLNMLYTNEDLERIMVNGEEGVDYELVDGQAEVKQGGYNLGNYVVGNNLLALPVYGNGADFYSEIAEINANATLSPYLGFALDLSDLDTVVSQISAVTDQYKCTMQCGGYTEEYLQEYLTKLDEAGVQDYLNAIQTQLDAWAAEQ